MNNKYNQNFRNRFCGCECDYDPFEQKGTMFQCLGLGTHETGGCGEDWWHPGCLVGLGPKWFENMPKETKPASKDSNGNGTLPVISEDVPAVPSTENGNADEEEEDEDEDPPNPPGFPADEDFHGFLCYKCVEAYPWMKRYAGTPGFLPPVFLKKSDVTETASASALPVEGEVSKKRKADEDDEVETETQPPTLKRQKSEPLDAINLSNGSAAELVPTAPAEASTEVETATVAIRTTTTIKTESIETEAIEITTTKKLETTTTSTTTDSPTTETTAPATKKCKLLALPPPPDPARGPFSLFFTEDFRDSLCHCPSCFPLLTPHPQLLEEEENYEPPVSEDGNNDTRSEGGSSLLERGESALRNVDRVRAIEGVMAYNHLKDKLKPFFQQFAESGQAISAEDIKGYFAKLRGDEQGMKEASEGAASTSNGGGGGGGGKEDDNRREGTGY